MGSSSSGSFKVPKPPKIDPYEKIKTAKDFMAQEQYLESRQEEQMGVQSTINPKDGYGQVEATAMSTKPKEEKTLMSSASKKKKKNSDIKDNKTKILDGAMALLGTHF